MSEKPKQNQEDSSKQQQKQNKSEKKKQQQQQQQQGGDKPKEQKPKDASNKQQQQQQQQKQNKENEPTPSAAAAATSTATTQPPSATQPPTTATNTTTTTTTKPSKSSLKNTEDSGNKKSTDTNESSKECITAPVTLQLSKKKAKQQDEDDFRKFKLFNHLKFSRDLSSLEKLPFDNPPIHPAFIKLGLRYANGIVSGSNSRCLALLDALKHFIYDFKTPKECKDIGKEIEAKLKPSVNFLTLCRPLAVSMGNAIKEFKQHISQNRDNLNETNFKKELIEYIDKYSNERIKVAGQTICKYILAHEDIVISGLSYAKSKLTNDDCVLVYGSSSLVNEVLKAAHKQFKNIKVIIVDSRPKLTGRKTLELLSKRGIDCTYVLINAVSFVMSRVTKVILGAHALLANGYVMSSVGSSQIALVAKSFNVPVIVCCETYKFCDKMQTDVFVNNELGNPNELLSLTNKFNQMKQATELAKITNNNPTSAPASTVLPQVSDAISITTSEIDPSINIINLIYDVTPPDLIACVVTDMGMLPCTSVPVVLRVKNRENVFVTPTTKKKTSESTVTSSNN